MSPDDPRRNAIASTASLEAVDVVHAKSGDDPDDTGQPPRKGWSRLLEYFHVAAPGVWEDDMVHYLQEGLPSWCGIFALWAIKKSGFPVGTWRRGFGISSVSGITNVFTPLPGDIGYINDNQHHCVIQRLSADGQTIFSIDGNSGIDGEIVPRSRPKRAFAAFYTISDRVTGATPGDVPASDDPSSSFPPFAPAFPQPGFSPTEPSSAPIPGAPPDGGGQVYVVQPGDTLSGIARQAYGNPNLWNRIYQANRSTIGPNPGAIYPGQQLVIP